LPTHNELKWTLKVKGEKYRRSVERHACLARLNVPVLRTLTEDMQAYSPTFCIHMSFAVGTNDIDFANTYTNFGIDRYLFDIYLDRQLLIIPWH
jgi:hypothetical protein